MFHLVSDMPVETHVFLSLLYRKPFFCHHHQKNGIIWKIDDGKEVANAEQ